jgi:hypothetical protein
MDFSFFLSAYMPDELYGGKRVSPRRHKDMTSKTSLRQCSSAQLLASGAIAL